MFKKKENSNLFVCFRVAFFFNPFFFLSAIIHFVVPAFFVLPAAPPHLTHTRSKIDSEHEKKLLTHPQQKGDAIVCVLITSWQSHIMCVCVCHSICTPTNVFFVSRFFREKSKVFIFCPRFFYRNLEIIPVFGRKNPRF